MLPEHIGARDESEQLAAAIDHRKPSDGVLDQHLEGGGGRGGGEGGG